MSKIKQLVMDNFQGHEHTVVDFDENVTIITGDTDSGKTSIFRALQKIIYDAPNGVEFISTWSKACTLQAIMDDGITVERHIEARTTKSGERVLSSHHYKITYPDGNEELFTGFGKTIPDEVTDVFDMNPISVGNANLNLNFSGQHDPYFLVSQGEGLLRMKVLSRISNAELFEHVRGNVKKKERSNKGKKRVLEEEKTELITEIEAFDKYDGLDDKFQSVQENMKRVETLKQTKIVFNKLLKLEEQANFYSEKIDAMKNTLLLIKKGLLDLFNKNKEFQSVKNCLNKIELYNNKLRVLNGCFMKLTNYDDVSAKIDTLTEKASKLRAIRIHIEKYCKSKTSLSKLSKLPTEDKLNKITQEFEKVVLKYDEYKNYKTQSMRFDSAKNELQATNQKVVILQKQIDKVSEQVTEFLKKHPICPTCGSDLQDMNTESVLNGLD